MLAFKEAIDNLVMMSAFSSEHGIVQNSPIGLVHVTGCYNSIFLNATYHQSTN